MRRIKSAPANLATMTNKNKNIISTSKKNNNFNNKQVNVGISLVSYLNNKKKYYNYNYNYNKKNNNKQDTKFQKNMFIGYLLNKKQINEMSKNEISKNEMSKNEISKNELSKNQLESDLTSISNLLTDITVDVNSFSLEETSLIYSIVLYLNENIFKKDKLKEFYSFIVKALIRYHVMLFIHVYVLHDKIDNVAKIVNAINSDDIVNTLNTLPFHIN